jgi:hypothetical protein
VRAPADLIDLAYAADGRVRRIALDELGKQGDLRVLDLAADVTLRNGAGWTPGMPRALEHLGGRAVDAARAWVDGGDTTLARLGSGVLAAHGDRSDAPTLSNAVTRAAQAGSWCALESPARGLGRIGHRDAADLLALVSASGAVSAEVVDRLAGFVRSRASWGGVPLEQIDVAELRDRIQPQAHGVAWSLVPLRFGSPSSAYSPPEPRCATGRHAARAECVTER